MYEVKTTGQRFDTFGAAVDAAHDIGSEVIEVATGLRRWRPLTKVSLARKRRYAEQAAAFAAQERSKSK